MKRLTSFHEQQSEGKAKKVEVRYIQQARRVENSMSTCAAYLAVQCLAKCNNASLLRHLFRVTFVLTLSLCLFQDLGLNNHLIIETRSRITS